MYKTKQMIELLTAYRAIPAMYRALTARGPIRYRAEYDLARIFDVPQSEIQDILKPFKNWIVYSMSDFLKYTSEILEEDECEKSYWPRMSEEARLITNIMPFGTGLHPSTILDVGAGSSPYLKLFTLANDNSLHYISLDKREKGLRHEGIRGARISHYIGDVMKLTKDKWEMTGWKPNVLFLGNFLHCLEDIEEFFKLILRCVPTIKIIKILEPKPGTALDFLFDYHMMEHCLGQRFDSDSLKCVSKAYTIESLGDYHNIYTIEL